MWGYEGEELADIEATYEHVKACRPDVFFTTVSYPIKGTPYYDEVAPKLVQLGAWRATTDRDVQHSRPPLAPILPAGRPTAAQRDPAEDGGCACRARMARGIQRGGGMTPAAALRPPGRRLRRAVDHHRRRPRAARSGLARIDPLFRAASACWISAAARAKTPLHLRRAASACTRSMRRRRWSRVARRAADSPPTVAARKTSRGLRAAHVRRRDLEFRRAELRGGSSRGGRALAALVRPGGASRSA